jgi:hypothetical protein
LGPNFGLGSRTGESLLFQILTDQSLVATASTWDLLDSPPNRSPSVTQMPAMQVFGAHETGRTFPTLMAAIAIEVMNRLNVEKQEM